MKNVLVFILVIALALGMYLGWSSSRESSPSAIRISVNSWVGFGPLYVAEAFGIFEKNGVEVDISQLEAGADRRAALISDRIDILASTLDDLAVTLGHNVDAIAIGCADYSNGGDGILVGGGVKTIDDLAEAEVAVDPGFVNHFFLLYVLDRNGLPIDRFTINPMKPDDAGVAFITGDVNAAVTWEPHLSEAIERRPDAAVLVRSNDYPEAILDLFVAKRAWVDENPDKLVGFRASWDQAVEFVAQRPQEAHEVMAQQFGLSVEDVAGMISGAKLLKFQPCSDLLKEDAESLGDDVVRLWRAAGYLNGEVDLGDALELP